MSSARPQRVELIQIDVLPAQSLVPLQTLQPSPFLNALLIIQGTAMLLPATAFSTAESYYRYRLCGAQQANSFQSWFGVVFNLASGLGLTFSVTAQHRFKTRARVLVPSACVRLILLSFSVQVPLVLSLLLFLVTTIIVLVPPSAMPAESLFATTTTTLAVIGFANAIQQGSFFGIVGMLPARYMGSMMKGFGLAGLVMSAASVITAAASSSLSADICQEDYGSLKWSAFAYFLFTVLMYLLSWLLYEVMERMEFVRVHAKLGRASGGAVAPTAIVAGDSAAAAADLSTPQAPAATRAHGAAVVRTARRISVLIYAVVLNFATTFLMFPAVTVKIKSVFQDTQSARFFHDLFTPCGFVTYSVADFFGRVCAGKKQLIPNTKGGHAVLAAVVTLRLVFVPLFLLCNVVPDKGYESELTVVFNNDAWFFVFMFIFSASGGYLGSLTMMYGPSQVPAEDQENAGTMMVFFLTFGLILGSACSFGWQPLINSSPVPP